MIDVEVHQLFKGVWVVKARLVGRWNAVLMDVKDDGGSFHTKASAEIAARDVRRVLGASFGEDNVK